MSTAYICDLCGEPIAADESRGTIQPIGVGRISRRAFDHSTGRDFHAATDRDCYGRYLEALTDGARQAAAHRATEIAEQPATRRDWQRETTVREREHQVLTILADDHLTVSELYWRATDAIDADYSFGHSSITSIVNRLYKRGDLDRAPEPFGRTRVRYRYFRRSKLEGPIAELQRAFDDEVAS